mmetsp:Transcript_25790/g.53625  ORF Transcript_25790/g.53625 Transcript_25790/m.53625 type:complete len:344 (+) Transcript_25790:172-1203(+)
MSQAGLFLGLNPDSYMLLATALLSAVIMAVLGHLMSIRVVEQQRAERAARNVPPPPSPTSRPSPAKSSGPNATLDLHGILNSKNTTKEEEYSRQRGGPVRSLRSKRTVKKADGGTETISEATPFYDCETFVGEEGEIVTFDTLWNRMGVPDRNPFEGGNSQGEGGCGVGEGARVLREPPYLKLSELVKPRVLQYYVKKQAQCYATPAANACFAIPPRALSALAVATINNLIVGCGGLATIILSGKGLKRMDAEAFCAKHMRDGGGGGRIFVKEHRVLVSNSNESTVALVRQLKDTIRGQMQRLIHVDFSAEVVKELRRFKIEAYRYDDGDAGGFEKALDGLKF